MIATKNDDKPKSVEIIPWLISASIAKPNARITHIPQINWLNWYKNIEKKNKYYQMKIKY